MDRKRDMYTEMLLIGEFHGVDKKLLDIVKSKTVKIGIDKEGQIELKNVLDIFEKIVKEKLEGRFRYLCKKIPHMRHSLYQAYMIVALVLEENPGTSPEEAVYDVCNNEKFRRHLIFGWDETGYMLSREINPARLILPLEYLKQVGYSGKIMNRKIYEKVRKDYERFMKWYGEFRPLTESEFESKVLDDKDIL